MCGNTVEEIIFFTLNYDHNFGCTEYTQRATATGGEQIDIILIRVENFLSTVTQNKV